MKVMDPSTWKDYIHILHTYRTLKLEKHLRIVNGDDVTKDYFAHYGFTQPVFIPVKKGLRIKVPPSHFTIHDVMNHVGENMSVRVIDVQRQEEMEMRMAIFQEHFHCQPRKRLLNVLSLEFSHTKLSKLVDPPGVVKDLSVVDTLCDAHDLHDMPSVQKYCLMSMAGSYTDFHVDFGGSSVWYHVLWGKKIFYLLPPTSENLAAYQKWNSMPNSKTIFLPSILPRYVDSRGQPVTLVYKLRLRPGNTVLLPSGWIHAVYTPRDSLVFGGNFIHKYSIPMQLKIYEIELFSKTEKRFRFPLFERLHWKLAEHTLRELHYNIQRHRPHSSHTIHSARALMYVLPSWWEQRHSLTEPHRSYYLPKAAQCNCEKLMLELQNLLQSVNMEIEEVVKEDGGDNDRSTHDIMDPMEGEEEEEEGELPCESTTTPDLFKKFSL